MPKVTIKISIEWKKSDSDGSQCECCEEICFLSMWNPVASASKHLKPTAIDFAICDACYEALNP